MLDSVRVRLTFWYSAVLACALFLLSLTTYWIVKHSIMQSNDAALADLADSFLVTLHAELPDSTAPDRVRSAALQAITEHRFPGHMYAVLNSQGNVLVTSRDFPLSNAQENANLERAFSSGAFQSCMTEALRSDRSFSTISGPRHGFRCFSRSFLADGQQWKLATLESLHDQGELLAKIRLASGWLVPLFLVLATTGGYFLARKSLAPVDSMSRYADRISAENLHERLLISNANDELGRLAKTINNLLDRLSQSFEHQRQFIADASHELRTPIAILNGEIEVALSQPSRSSSEYRDSLENLQQEAKRLARIVDDLFTLSRADSGQYPLAPQDFYLDELVASCVHSVRSLALAKKIALDLDNRGELPICADETLLRRMLLNLLDNALKYTPEGGKVAVSCASTPAGYELTIFNSGPAIPEVIRGRIFERFFRADPARSWTIQNGGAGLGLSIARWIAESHHGQLQLVRSDSEGNTFKVFLPSKAPSLISTR
jgi:two-component system, OmpR family, sensor kinase